MPKPLLLASLELHPPLARPTAHMGYQERGRERNFAAEPDDLRMTLKGRRVGLPEEDVRAASRLATAAEPTPSTAFLSERRSGNRHSICRPPAISNHERAS